MTKQLATVVVALALCLAGCGLMPHSDQVQLITAPASHTGCFVADQYGLLVVDPTDGTALTGTGHPNMRLGSDGLSTVAWPHGFTARRSGSEVEVLDPQGNVVATTGRSYHFLGGFVQAGGAGLGWPELTKSVLLACGHLDLWPEASQQ